MADQDTGDLALARLCLAELVGTALLVMIGLSFVILDFGAGSPVAAALPSAGARRALTGGLFGATGMLIALSPVGRVSGAHINPVVSLAFWVERALPGRTLVAFVASQCIGAAAGAAPLLLWGARGSSISYGAATPGPRGLGPAFAGEVVTTFIMVLIVLAMVAHPRVRSRTPFVFPPLYCLMVWAEAPLSGTSTNPARSLGPDLVSLAAHSYWLYVVAPAIGALLAVAARRGLPLISDATIEVAKIAHFEAEAVHVLVTREGARRPRAVARRRRTPIARRRAEQPSEVDGPALQAQPHHQPREPAGDTSGVGTGLPPDPRPPA